MAKLYGTIINDTIYPASTDERFATHDALYGKGGYRAVNTIAERDAIPVNRLDLGAEVRVMEEEGSPVYYVSSMSPLTWKKLNTSVDKSDVTTIIDELKGAASGIAPLNESGKVPSEYLPEMGSQEVFRGYFIDSTTFNDESGNPYTPTKKAIYIDLSTNRVYSYNGEIFVRDSVTWIEV